MKGMTKEEMYKYIVILFSIAVSAVLLTFTVLGIITKINRNKNKPVDEQIETNIILYDCEEERLNHELEAIESAENGKPYEQLLNSLLLTQDMLKNINEDNLASSIEFRIISAYNTLSSEIELYDVEIIDKVYELYNSFVTVDDLKEYLEVNDEGLVSLDIVRNVKKYYMFKVTNVSAGLVSGKYTFGDFELTLEDDKIMSLVLK